MKTWSGKDSPIIDGQIVESAGVSVLDLVVQLGRTRRFGGWGAADWTVAHHTLLVQLLWIRAGYPLDQLHHALLHDAHEAYTGDVVQPVKQALKTFGAGDAVKKLESALDGVIYGALGVGTYRAEETLAWIKACDFAALLIEAKAFGPPGCYEAVVALDWPKLTLDMRADVRGVLAAAGFVGPGGVRSTESAHG